ncbi:MAG: pimeloyl-ACP methyl ester carboxylesterase [Paraglaciecola sp.]|jgi:pimeloyl-ACP methyl ester carboxylesterase
MSTQTWKSTGSNFNYNKHAIFYKDQGKGEVLLLIHGFPTSSYDWHKLYPELTKRFRVIALDMIGFGFSDKPRPYNYSILDQADIHEALLKKLGIEACHILAHDYGDTVAQELLARFNESKLGVDIRSICLLNGGLFPETHHPRLIQTLLISPIGFILSALFSKKKLQSNFNAIFGPDTQSTQEEINEFWELIAYNDGKNVMHRLIRYMAERKQHRERWVGALQNAAIPIRLIDGSFDPISGKHMAKRYQELIPNPDVILLENIGHYPQTEAPELVLEHYLEFVNL